MTYWHLVSGALGIAIGAVSVVIFLFKKITRIDENIRTSDKLLTDCRKEKAEIDRVKYGLHHSLLLRSSDVKHVVDWPMAKFKAMLEFPKDTILIVNSNDLREYCEKIKG